MQNHHVSSCKQIRKNPRCTFLECRIHLCDFHREKAWNEWLSKIDHGMSTRKDEVLGYLRSIASSASKVDLEKNTLAFKSSEVWKILLPYRSSTMPPVCSHFHAPDFAAGRRVDAAWI